MAEAKKEAAAPAKAAAPKKGGGKIGFIMLAVIFGAAFPFIMPTVLIAFVGMIPTLIALFTDMDRQKSSTASVGFMNGAGVLPFLFDLWIKGQTMEVALQILGDPSSWVIMFGAAAIGQLIVFAIPQAMASLTLARSESRLKILKHNLEQLKSTWGPDVATTKPLDKVGKPE